MLLTLVTPSRSQTAVSRISHLVPVTQDIPVNLDDFRGETAERQHDSLRTKITSPIIPQFFVDIILFLW